MVKKKTSKKKETTVKKTGLLGSLMCWVMKRVGGCRSCSCN